MWFMNQAADRILPKIGTAVWIRHQGKILLGLRSKTSGNNTWGPPGGHLEMNETLVECAIRETREEAGIELANVKFLTYAENIFKEAGTHYVTFHFTADWASGDLTPDPNEFHNLEWFDWDNLPKPLFRPAQIFFDAGLNPVTF
ncbi:NUDIX domain-containing protein [Candidatus Parcubacteria bacterium]|nr:MAG: NUDIX domain-containing protein [Candidatus Parcubacteria bacterium]